MVIGSDHTKNLCLQEVEEPRAELDHSFLFFHRSMFLYILYNFTSVLPTVLGFWVLHRAASAAASSGSQLVPDFDERFSVLPDQLVTKQDVPSEERRNI